MRLYQSHADAGSPRDVACGTSCGACCRAPSRNHRGGRPAPAGGSVRPQRLERESVRARPPCGRRARAADQYGPACRCCSPSRQRSLRAAQPARQESLLRRFRAALFGAASIGSRTASRIAAGPCEANPELSALLDESIGSGWRQNLESIERLDQFATDAAFGEKLRRVKLAHRRSSRASSRRRPGMVVDPNAMFDVHIKRIHEYKRQLLNILQRYRALECDSAGTSTGLGAARRHLGRQGGIGLLARQAHHQARLRRRRAHQSRSEHHGPAEAGLPAELQRLHSPRPSSPRADLSQQISPISPAPRLRERATRSSPSTVRSRIGTADGANIEMADAVGSRQRVPVRAQR